MNPYVIVICVLIGGSAFLDISLDLMSMSRLKKRGSSVPSEFQGELDASEYAKILQYQAVNNRFSLASEIVNTAILLAFIFLGGFNVVDLWAREHAERPLWMALLFAAVLAALRLIIQLPWSAYRTFVIEEKFGFNKTTPKTFMVDLIKGIVIGAILGGAIFAAVVYFFETAGPMAWFYSWLAFTFFQLALVYLAPVLLLPLFNKFKELPDGDLKEAIGRYNQRNQFKMSGIFTMDSSRRSTKGNAFFTGFGQFKRLVLFDTLLERQSTDELVAIYAHEVGHYKLGHILKFTAISVASSAILFFVCSLFIGSPDLFAAFRMEEVSVYASLIFIALLYAPLARLLALFGNAISRKAEFEADRYSVETFGSPETLVSALKKLATDNLSNLDPHPLRVFFDYTHPPILRRIETLREMIAGPDGTPLATVRRIR